MLRGSSLQITMPHSAVSVRIIRRRLGVRVVTGGLGVDSLVLASLFPKAKFVHLVRDGRKVVSSFFYKLNSHDYRSAKILKDWFEGTEALAPPLDEKFWWPCMDDDRFARICRHWVESNKAIFKALDRVDEENKLFFRLEDMVASEKELKRFLDFLSVSHDPSFVSVLKRPEHVYVPVDFKLTKEQEEKFVEVAMPMMRKLGYNGEEYRVEY